MVLTGPTIAAVFKSLNESDQNPEEPSKAKKINLDEIIMNAKTVNGLLKIADSQPDISRTHALKVLEPSTHSTLPTTQ